MSDDNMDEYESEFIRANEESQSRKKKVNQACIFCKRSHMPCDEGRPCQRCVKRRIAALCRDEDSKTSDDAMVGLSLKNGVEAMGYNINEFRSEEMGSEMNTDSMGFNFKPEKLEFATELNAMKEMPTLTEAFGGLPTNSSSAEGYEFSDFLRQAKELGYESSSSKPKEFDPRENAEPEKYFTLAADPNSLSLDSKLNEMLKAKFESGLMKPYNYVQGYIRLRDYMNENMEEESRQRILRVLTTFIPVFKVWAESATDMDLLLVEESFERLLLDYDRVFYSFGIPACLWRRTGEIFRANPLFADMVEMTCDELSEGKLGIYELFNETSSVNYWEKYGLVSFDVGQKAVLTSCVLTRKKSKRPIRCCFSFTIRRDAYRIPFCIVVRCRLSNQQTFNLDLPESASWNDLVENILSKSTLHQVSSVKVGFPPKTIQVDSPSQLLVDLGVRKGDLLIVEEKPAKTETTKPLEVVGEKIPSKIKENVKVKQENTSSSSGTKNSTKVETKLTVKKIDDDNSCLFNSIGYAMYHNVQQSDELRQIVASIVLSSDDYSDAVLGRPKEDYVDWILKPASWGGAIEMAIFSAQFGVEIASVDIKTNRLDIFGQDKGYSQRMYLLYDGIHYDVFLRGEQTLFSSDDDTVAVEALSVANLLQKKRKFTDTGNFSLKCQICKAVVKGEKGAQEHGEKTGHSSFSEV